MHDEQESRRETSALWVGTGRTPEKSLWIFTAHGENHAFRRERDTRDKESDVSHKHEAPCESVAFRPWTQRVRASCRCPKSFRTILSNSRSRNAIREFSISQDTAINKKGLTIVRPFLFMVRPERFELPTFWFVARRSIQLSYGRNNF